MLEKVSCLYVGKLITQYKICVLLAPALQSLNSIGVPPTIQQEKLVEFCHRYSIQVTAYSPFGGKSYETFGVSAA